MIKKMKADTRINDSFDWIRASSLVRGGKQVYIVRLTPISYLSTRYMIHGYDYSTGKVILQGTDKDKNPILFESTIREQEKKLYRLDMERSHLNKPRIDTSELTKVKYDGKKRELYEID